MHRRTYLRRATALTVFGTISTTASADGYPSRPDHISSVTGDVDVIEDYQPSVIASYDARTSMIGTYGWRAESENYDVDAYFYWLKWPTQDGFFSGVVSDSHFLDHEPVVVYVNPDGSVESVVYSGYHHFVSEVQGDNAALVEDQVAGTPTHPKLQIIDPHHHFKHYEKDDQDGVRPDTISGTEFDSWLAVRKAWYDRGVFKNSHKPAIENPFLLRRRDTLWADGSFDAWAGKHLWPLIGGRGYDSRDELRSDDV